MERLLVCPGCGDNAGLYSVETITVEYSVSIVKTEKGNDLQYTGESLYFDEGSEYRNEIHCRVCDWAGSESDLKEAET